MDDTAALLLPVDDEPLDPDEDVDEPEDPEPLLLDDPDEEPADPESELLDPASDDDPAEPDSELFEPEPLAPDPLEESRLSVL